MQRFLRVAEIQIHAAVASVQDDFLCRVGANGDKDPKKVKVYYRKLRADFDKAIDEIFEDLASLNA